MRRARVAATALLACALPAVTLSAQLPYRSIEIFDSVQGIAGVGPVRVAGATHMAVHGGLRLDGGFQGEQLAGGFGFRYTELLPTGEYGGHGLDFLLHAEWRAARDAHTSVRVATGLGLEAFETKSGVPAGATDVSTITGLAWSVGVVRELLPRGDSHLVLSADLVSPPVSSGTVGRRAPTLELGFGYRWRTFHGIGMPRM